MTGKAVPLVVYDTAGNRQIVGEVELDGDHLSGTIMDRDFAERLGLLDASAYSIGFEPAVPAHPSLFAEQMAQYAESDVDATKELFKAALRKQNDMPEPGSFEDHLKNKFLKGDFGLTTRREERHLPDHNS